MRQYDLAVFNGTIIDGLGTPGYKGNIFLRDGKVGRICSKGEQFSSKKCIDAEGLVVSPGFIDMHTHDDFIFHDDPWNMPKLTQGVTSVAVGSCGMGTAVSEVNIDGLYTYQTPVMGQLFPKVSSVEDYFRFVEDCNPAINVAIQVGHIPLRVAVAGFEGRHTTEIEQQAMAEMAYRALKLGCIGISTGLQYQPVDQSDEKELLTLARVVKEFDGLFSFHMRDLFTGFLEALDEVIALGKNSKARIQVSHLRCYGRSNYGKPIEALARIEKAVTEGVDIGFDNYPYTAGATTIAMVLPKWLVEGGTEKSIARLRDPELDARVEEELRAPDSLVPQAGSDNIIILGVNTPENKQFEGSTLAEFAIAKKSEPIKALLNLYQQEQGQLSVAVNWYSQQDVDAVMEHPEAIVISDSIHTRGKPHPRLYGAFAKFLKEYASKALTLEESIRKMTSAPARRMGFADIGVLKPGYKADIAIFDITKIEDIATYAEPRRFSRGIEHVIVNGEVVFSEGATTGSRPGKLLLRK